MGCKLDNVSHLHTLCQLKDLQFSHHDAKVVSSLFFADGILCMVFAFFTHFKYTSVTVLNYSVYTKATCNTRWIWFYIFTSLSSFMNGLNFWINFGKDCDDSNVPFAIGWIAHLLGILSLAFAIKHQWKYKEEAFQEMSSENDNERTPILGQQESMVPSVADISFVGCFLMGLAFFIAALSCDTSGDNPEKYYWSAFSFSWLIRIGIFTFIMLIVTHGNPSPEGPSVLVKCLLLIAVLFSTPVDIPSFVWIKCILNKDPAVVYNVLIGFDLLSQMAFFVVLRAEFLRLKDVTRWHVAGNLDHLERDNTSVPTT